MDTTEHIQLSGRKKHTIKLRLEETFSGHERGKEAGRVGIQGGKAFDKSAARVKAEERLGLIDKKTGLRMDDQGQFVSKSGKIINPAKLDAGRKKIFEEARQRLVQAEREQLKQDPAEIALKSLDELKRIAVNTEFSIG